MRISLYWIIDKKQYRKLKIHSLNLQPQQYTSLDQERLDSGDGSEENL